MKRTILALVLLASANAHAGFIAGVGVGVLASSGGKAKPTEGATLISSDKHDVIICEKSTSAGNVCVDTYQVEDRTSYSHTRHVNHSPQTYAAAAGYRTVHRIGTALQGNRTWIVMEVSK